MGAQTVSVTRSLEANSIIQKGNPTNVYNYYKKPTLSITVNNFLTSTGGNSLLSGFNLQNKIYIAPEPKDIKIDIVNGGGLLFKDFLLKSISYTFPTQGNFTEQLTYEGHVVESSSSSSDFSGGTDSGQAGRRQHYSLGGEPAEVAALLNNGHSLLNVEVGMNLNYGSIPTYGGFYTVYNKYLSMPVDISCTYEILDRGYVQSKDTYIVSDLGRLIDDQVEDKYVSVAIGGPPAINLGDKCFLTNVDRSGGDAGQNNYSIYKYTYKNNDNNFTVS
jgi:hypothetical protein